MEFYFEDLFLLLKNSIKDASEVLLAAPYIKEHTIIELFRELQPNANLKVYSRWLTHDIQNGSTDIEIYPLIKQYGGSLYIHSRLHAKYYRFDENYYSGSANLTRNGLQPNSIGNLEVLSWGEVNELTKEFESKLMRESILVNDEIYETYKEILFSSEQVYALEDADYYWPSFGSLDGLWEIYLNGDASESSDLKTLRIPKDLNREQFIKFLRIRFLEFENLSSIEVFLSGNLEGRRFGEVRKFVRDLDPTIDETEIWKRLMKLYLELFPHKYEYFRPHYTEIIRPK